MLCIIHTIQTPHEQNQGSLKWSWYSSVQGLPNIEMHPRLMHMLSDYGWCRTIDIIMWASDERDLEVLHHHSALGPTQPLGSWNLSLKMFAEVITARRKWTCIVHLQLPVKLHNTHQPQCYAVYHSHDYESSRPKSEKFEANTRHCKICRSSKCALYQCACCGVERSI